MSDPAKVKSLLWLTAFGLTDLFNGEMLVQYPPGTFQCTLADPDRVTQNARKLG